jgi:hypothetical protein
LKLGDDRGGGGIRAGRDVLRGEAQEGFYLLTAIIEKKKKLKAGQAPFFRDGGKGLFLF